MSKHSVSIPRIVSSVNAVCAACDNITVSGFRPIADVVRPVAVAAIRKRAAVFSEPPTAEKVASRPVRKRKSLRRPRAVNANGNRRLAYGRQRQVAHLFPSSPTAYCGRFPVHGLDAVAVTASGGRVGLSGAIMCENFWLCAVCSRYLAAKRANEANIGLAEARKLGLSAALVTFTMAHKLRDKLGLTLADMKAARRRWFNHRSVKAFRAKYGLHSITATEILWGPGNGWHPHLHMIVLSRAAPDVLLAELESLRSAWIASLTGLGRSGGGAAYQVQDGSAAGSYISKGWGLGAELSLGGEKSSNSGLLHPFDLLDDPVLHGLFREYQAATKGRQSLAWSKGLKALLNVPALVQAAADAAAADAPERVIVGWLTRLQMSDLVRVGRCNVFEAGEAAGPDPAAIWAAVLAALCWSDYDERRDLSPILIEAIGNG